MATKRSLPQDSPLPGDKKKKRKRRLPTGVVEKKIYSHPLGHPDRKLLKTYRYMRVRYRGADGKMHSKQEPLDSNATEREVRSKLKSTHVRGGETALKHYSDTFNELADYYEDKYLVPAQYVDGKKIHGRRNTAVPKSQLNSLRELIGGVRCRDITYEVCHDVRLSLLNKPTRATRAEPQGHQRSMIDVDRRMQLLRHVLKVGKRTGRMVHDPFADAPEPLITPAHEKKRRRIMSFDEERKLLEQCVDRHPEGLTKQGAPYKTWTEKRAHLRIVIIGLVDTLMRPGEFLKLRESDPNFDLNRATVQQMNTKTLNERAAPISERFALELRAWFDGHPVKPGERIFPFKGVKTAWKGLKETAGVTDLRLRDLRRTGATRLLRIGMPIEEISRILGHTTTEMTYEYIGVDKDTTSRAVELLNAMHKEREEQETVH